MSRIPRIQCDLNFGLPVLIVLGLIYSVWTCDYFMKAFYLNFFDLKSAIVNTYYLICISVAVMLYAAFKDSKKQWFNYWYLSKLFDSALIASGALMYSFSIRYCLWHLVTSAPILAAGWYIITCVKLGYESTGREIEPIAQFLKQWTNSLKQMHEEEPPTYDEAVETKQQQNYDNFAVDILRTWGFSQILVLILIFPAISFIILNTLSYTNPTYSYWFIFSLVAGLILAYITTIKYICKIIPSPYDGPQQSKE